jgi:hypothetical protein
MKLPTVFALGGINENWMLQISASNSGCRRTASALTHGMGMLRNSLELSPIFGDGLIGQAAAIVG